MLCYTYEPHRPVVLATLVQNSMQLEFTRGNSQACNSPIGVHLLEFTCWNSSRSSRWNSHPGNGGERIVVSRVRPCSLAPDMHCAVVQVIEKELFSLEVLFSLDVVLFSLDVFSTFVVFA